LFDSVTHSTHTTQLLELETTKKKTGLEELGDALTEFSLYLIEGLVILMWEQLVRFFNGSCIWHRKPQQQITKHTQRSFNWIIWACWTVSGGKSPCTFPSNVGFSFHTFDPLLLSSISQNKSLQPKDLLNEQGFHRMKGELGHPTHHLNSNLNILSLNLLWYARPPLKLGKSL